MGNTIDWTQYAHPSATEIDFSGYATGKSLESALSGATALTAPPKPFTSAWFREKADRLTDYFPALGAAIGGITGTTGGPIGSVSGAALGGAAGESARELTQRALGTNFNVPQTSGEAAGQIGKEAAISGGTQVLSEGLGAAARAAAPNLAESALKIPATMRGRGRTIGEQVLESTSGFKPSQVSKSAGEAVDNLTNQMEGLVDQATSNGQMGSTQAEHQMIDDAVANTPRNARELRGKLREFHDMLDLDQTGNIAKGMNVGPRQDFTPSELLELKRGIGKEIDKWPPEWQHSNDIVRLKMKLYGSIDHQLDQLAPGSGELNQQISSLIPAMSQGLKVQDQASLIQSMAHRALAHTGALTSAVGGGLYGYREGGTPGAIIGGLAGIAGPELLAAPSSQMVAARTLHLLAEHPELSTAALQLLAGQVSKAPRDEQAENK